MEMELTREPKENDQVWIWDNAAKCPIFVTIGKHDRGLLEVTPVGEPEKVLIISMFAPIFDTAEACRGDRRAFFADQLAQFARNAERERVVLQYLESATRESAMKLDHFRATVERMRSELDTIGAWEVTECAALNAALEVLR